MSGEFTASLSREDFISAYWFYTRWLWLWRRLLIALGLVTLLYSGLMITLDGFYALQEPSALPDYLLTGAIYALLVGGFVVLLTLFTLPRRLKRLYDDLQVAGRETRFEFDQDGIRSSNRDGSASFAWSRFKHTIENDQFLMLVLSRWSFIIVPKQQVPEETVAGLRTAMDQGGVPAR